jgi:site-specific recombinase XerC
MGISVKTISPGHLTTVGKLFREARDKAGLPKYLVLYCSRHDYGTRVLRETGNLAAVMKTMGHNDVRTAMKYQHPELFSNVTAHYDLCRNQKLGKLLIYGAP